MNEDQQAFATFMMSSVQAGQESAMQAVLSQVFVLQNAGALGVAQLQALVPQMATLLRPECISGFYQQIATFSSQLSGPTQTTSVTISPVVSAPAPAPVQQVPVQQVVQPVVQPVIEPVTCCQSCGIPFETPAMQAMEMNGALSPYCTGCYANGGFVNPGATVANMVEMGVSRLAYTMGADRAREHMNRVVPNLGRWRR